MQILILKPEIKQAVKTNRLLAGELADVNKIGFWTLGQWRLKDDQMLTTATNLAIIRRHLKLADDAVLTEPKEVEDPHNIPA